MGCHPLASLSTGFSKDVRQSRRGKGRVTIGQFRWHNHKVSKNLLSVPVRTSSVASRQGREITQARTADPASSKNIRRILLWGSLPPYLSRFQLLFSHQLSSLASYLHSRDAAVTGWVGSPGHRISGTPNPVSWTRLALCSALCSSVPAQH